MNERIRELALQAGYQRINDYYTNGTVTAFTDEQIEKFAELIVKECKQVSLKHSHRDDDMGAIIARHIKEHFGVE